MRSRSAISGSGRSVGFFAISSSPTDSQNEEFCVATVVLILVAAAHNTSSAARLVPTSGYQQSVYNVGMLQLLKLQLKRRFHSGIMQNIMELHNAKAVCMGG